MVELAQNATSTMLHPDAMLELNLPTKQVVQTRDLIVTYEFIPAWNKRRLAGFVRKPFFEKVDEGLEIPPRCIKR